MVRISGTCTFQEARNRPTARIFALCDTGGRRLTPVSLPDHQFIQGVDSTKEGRQIRLRITTLAPRLNRVVLGIYLPVGFDLNEDYRLQVTFDDNSRRILHPAVPHGEGKRFALLAIAVPTPHGWNVGRMDPPELFGSKAELNVAHPFAEWWLRSA